MPDTVPGFPVFVLRTFTGSLSSPAATLRDLRDVRLAAILFVTLFMGR